LGKQRVAVAASAPTAKEIEQALASEAQVAASYMSLSHHLRMHRACRDDELEPVDGSIVHQLWRKGQLTRQQLSAWRQWLADMNAAHGSTNGLCIGYEPRGDGGSTSNDHAAYHGPGTYWNAAQSRVEQVWKSLRFHERGLIEQLFRDFLKHSGVKQIHSHDLQYLGGFLSGYNDNRQKISAGGSAIQRLLTSLGEIYMIPHSYE
jgi:hypothetical protein